jgi:hypothetical protein
MSNRIMLSMLAALLPLMASAQDTCTAQYEAEQARIVREFSGKRPPKGDRDAEVTWSKNLNAALAASAKRAEDCTRANRMPASPTSIAKEQECIAAVNHRLAELDKRYSGHSLNTQEQIARRTEQDRLMDDRMQCINQAAKR